ncbi:hypothetical protein ACRARG_04545 [Pseudooceanicola sp. C21-150M6]|uniref:hypothetical protein n=1 Tax=Pseudooceanicola sp. C21-150M6 TaxID=3434355 RepID=UPI003D7FC75C
MSITAGQAALIRRIVTMTDPPNIVLPNGPGKGLPRYVVQVSGGAQRTMGVNGSTEARPEIVVRVETGTDYSTENDALVSALVARFAVGDLFDGVKITAAPSPRAALPVTDGVYSVPVVIRGNYHF